MTYSRFDVVLVRFPFTEKQGHKQRPSVILTNSAFNSNHRHAVTAMVTTASNTTWPSDLPITDFVDAGLRLSSVLRMKLFTVAEDLIIGRVGTLSSTDQRRVTHAMHALFSL